MNTKETLGITSKSFMITLALGSVESIIAMGFIILGRSDSKNAIIFGNSAPRLFLIIFTAILAVTFLYFSFLIGKKGLPNQFELLVSKNDVHIKLLSTILFLLGTIIALIPSTQMGKYFLFFEPIQPLFFILTTLPFQLFIPNLLLTNNIIKKEDLKKFLSVFFVFIILLGFISYSKLGLKADSRFWNVAGVPLTFLQLALALLVTLICLYIINQLLTTNKVSPIILDIGITILIYLIGLWVWSQTPMIKHFYALRPAPPAFQFFPYSDARDYDLGAISILNGYGINFGAYTDKPLYMVFLAILHFFAGYDYNKIGFLHLSCMALILPSLFWLGKNFHSRQFGMVLALITLIRQHNAILLSSLLAGTNPNLLTTELPILLGLTIFVNIVFLWLRKKHSNRPIWPFALLAGGILGAMSLIRLNPIGLVPIIIVYIIIEFRGMNKKWIPQVCVFLLGFLMMLTPWIITARDAKGTPYLWVKIIDVISVRYPSTNSKEENNQINLHIITTDHSRSISNSRKWNMNISSREFPIFVINHSLHNMVTALLALPDSPLPNDQNLKILIQRPYFNEKRLLFWDGNIPLEQVLFIIFNISFLALGISWSLKHWKWIGAFPAMVFITYTISLGLARSSGSRYIVPIDWIIFFYYILGIIIFIDKFTTIFSNSKSNIRLNIKNFPLHFSPAFAISIVLILASIIPIVHLPVITDNFPPCNKKSINHSYKELKLIQGQLLYPYKENNTFSFTFLSCEKRFDINLVDFDKAIQYEQSIVIGFSKQMPTVPIIIFNNNNSTLIPIWKNK